MQLWLHTQGLNHSLSLSLSRAQPVASADEGIPEFWLNSFANHNKVGQFITERDAEVLRCLEDVRVSVSTGEERGFTLSFHFGENPFFAEQVRAQ